MVCSPLHFSYLHVQFCPCCHPMWTCRESTVTLIYNYIWEYSVSQAGGNNISSQNPDHNSGHFPCLSYIWGAQCFWNFCLQYRQSNSSVTRKLTEDFQCWNFRTMNHLFPALTGCNLCKLPLVSTLPLRLVIIFFFWLHRDTKPQFLDEVLTSVDRYWLALPFIHAIQLVAIKY